MAASMFCTSYCNLSAYGFFKLRGSKWMQVVRPLALGALLVTILATCSGLCCWVRNVFSSWERLRCVPVAGGDKVELANGKSVRRGAARGGNSFLVAWLIAALGDVALSWFGDA